jgi:hypothetical protein
VERQRRELSAGFLLQGQELEQKWRGQVRREGTCWHPFWRARRMPTALRSILHGGHLDWGAGRT